MKGRKLVTTITLPQAEVREALLAHMRLKCIAEPPGELTGVSETLEPNEFSSYPVATGTFCLTWKTEKL